MRRRSATMRIGFAPSGRKPVVHFPARVRAYATALLLLFLAAPSFVSAQRRPFWPSSHREAVPEAAPGSENPKIVEAMGFGYDYLVGHRVAKDPVQAAYWYKKAADMGNADAQNILGYLYLHGIGVPQDQAQAARWFTRGTGGGSHGAKMNLAILYLKGIGVQRDPKLGAELLNQLAEKEDARAEALLGNLYVDGLGVPEDKSLAEMWFAKSAKKKCPEGQYAMGKLLSFASWHEHHFIKAAKLLRNAARSGFVPAISALGILLTHHPEIAQKRPDEAITMLQRAAEAGSWESSAALGTLARDGTSGRQDMGEAFRWFTIASRQGGSTAEKQTQASLAYCRKVLSPDQQERQQQIADVWLAQHPGRNLYVSDNGHNVPTGDPLPELAE